VQKRLRLQWREREGGEGSGETGRKQRPKCIRMYEQSKVESINEHCFEAPEKFSCSVGLDPASDSPDLSTRIGKEVQNTSRCCGCKRPTTDGDTTLALRLSDAETDYVYKV